jgi:hypothetical protein
MPRRNARGRFVRTHHHRAHSHRRRSRSTAIVRVERAPVARRTRTVYVSRRRRHHGGGGSIIGGSSKHDLKVKAELAGWASVLGYLESHKSDTYDKIPTFGKLPREAVVGLALHLVGRKHKHLDRASAAALAIAGYKIGAAGYSLSGFED